MATTNNKSIFTLVRAATEVMSHSDKKKLLRTAFLQILLSILDLVGVAAIGILGALTITGIQSRNPGNRTYLFLSLLRINNFSFVSQVTIVALTASIFLLLKTILSIITTRRIIHFLSARSAIISQSLLAKLFSRDLIYIRNNNSQDLLYSVTAGVNAITLGIIGNSITIIADSVLLLALFSGLLFLNPILAIASLLFFLSLAYFMYFKISKKAQQLGRLNSDLNIQSNKEILIAIDSFRDLVLKSQRNFLLNKIINTRKDLAYTNAELQFIPIVGKYVLEVGVILGALILSGFAFLIQDAPHAVSLLSIFLASSSRVAPAIMRIQQSAISLRSSLGNAQTTMNLIEELSNFENLQENSNLSNFEHANFIPHVSMENVSVRYPQNSTSTLKNINFEIEPGETVAITGKSGVGKTTLVDAMLGLVPIEKGSVKISGLPPAEALQRWPGAVGYVPQQMFFLNETVRKNITFAYPDDLFSNEQIWSALEKANLAEFVASLDKSLDFIVGENGSNLSGGQRQRLIIARALITNPKLLILDEATSALDNETERLFIEILEKLKGRITLISIAHRKTTISNSNLVFEIDGSSLMINKSNLN